MSDVIDRIVERNRLLWVVLSHEASEAEKHEALDRMLADDPFAKPTQEVR